MSPNTTIERPLILESLEGKVRVLGRVKAVPFRTVYIRNVMTF